MPRFGGVFIFSAGAILSGVHAWRDLEAPPREAVRCHATEHGLRVLWAAVVAQAIRDYWSATPGSVRWRAARKWIFNGRNAGNSFDNIAALLDLDPERLRAHILSIGRDRAAIARIEAAMHQSPAPLQDDDS